MCSVISTVFSDDLEAERSLKPKNNAESAAPETPARCLPLPASVQAPQHILLGRIVCTENAHVGTVGYEGVRPEAGQLEAALTEMPPQTGKRRCCCPLWGSCYAVLGGR